MSDCIFFTSGVCWKTTTDFTMQVSGNCTPCLLALNFGGFTNNKIPILPNNTELMSGARVQFNF